MHTHSLLAATLAAALAFTPALAQTGTAAAGTGAAAEKPKPLPGSEKTFLKNSLESMYLLMTLTDKNKRESIKGEETKNVAEKINTDLNKLWGELAPIATTHGEKLPEGISAGDKSKAERLSKSEGDKYDKDLLKLVTKETRALARAFESASKSAQTPELKQVVTNWATTVKNHDADAERAEKAAAKAK